MTPAAAFGAAALTVSASALLLRGALDQRRARRLLTAHRGPSGPGATRLVAQPAPAWVEALLARAGLDVPPSATWATARALAVALLVGAAATGGVGLAVGLGAAMPAVPALVRRALRHDADRQREAQLPGLLDAVEAGLRAGLGLVQALDSAVAAAPDPLAAELSTVLAEIAHGSPVDAALSRWGESGGPSSAVALTATALVLAADSGGEVARAVGRVAATLRERREVQAEVRALATQARASAVVLAAAPIGFTALVATVEPATLQFLLGTPTGWGCLVAGIGLEAAGALWMVRILRSVA